MKQYKNDNIANFVYLWENYRMHMPKHKRGMAFRGVQRGWPHKGKKWLQINLK